MYRKDNRKKKVLIILLGVFFVFFLIITLFKSFPPNFITRSVLYVAQPLFSLKSNLTSFYYVNISMLKNKKELQTENNFLKDKIKEMEASVYLSEIILNENKELKILLSHDSDSRELMLAYVLAKPGYGVYNSLIINKGSNHGVEEGTMVVAFDNVLLGHVSEVLSNTSVVRLISHPGEENNVFIENSVSAIAIGQGGENLEINLPHDVDVEVGYKILTFGSESLFLGVVEKIIREPAGSLKKIIFRLPINIQELQRVYLLR